VTRGGWGRERIFIDEMDLARKELKTLRRKRD